MTKGGEYWNVLDVLAGGIIFIVSVVSIFFMAAMCLAGIFSLTSALTSFEWHVSLLTTEHQSPNKAIKNTIYALELFILAPLPYVVLQGVGAYITLRNREPERRPEAEGAFQKVKAIVAGILVSTVVIKLVGMVLQADAMNPLTWQATGLHLLIIVVLTAYFIVMEKFAHAHTASVSARAAT